MYRIYKGIEQHTTESTRSAAVETARALSSEYRGRVQILREDHAERLRYSSGALMESELLTSSDRRRGRKLGVGSTP